MQTATELGLSSLRAEVPQTLSEWAAAHFILAGESSHQKGGWVGWPFQQGILDFMSDDRIEELAVKKSKRVGYTKMITAFVAYNIAHRRRKQALWQPTDDDRDSYVKSEIEPVLDGVAAVQAAAKTLNPDALMYVVVGDLSKVEASVRALNLGEVTVLDADGKPVAAAK